MADQEHLSILNQGLIVWNDWRRANPTIRPDLRGAQLDGRDFTNYRIFYQEPYIDPDTIARDRYTINFSGVDLREASLRKAHLLCADLSNADLGYANLEGAFLREASIYGADLAGAHCSEVDLIEAGLSNTNLSSANLTGACLWGTYLRGVNFSKADLTGADLSYARLAWTVFASTDLTSVRGLEKLEHEGPSTININTVTLPQDYEIRLPFLRGVGFSDVLIEYLPSLLSSAIQYHSCFISYAHQDEDLARRLYKDLQNNGIRCWYAPEDLKIGDKFRVRIDESIRLYDKLLLVLSEDSLASNWVAYEVEKALNKEPEGTPNVLFPIRLDKTILTCETDWAKDIRKSRHIGDFEHWKDHDAYQQAFQRLLRDLKAQS